MTRLLAAAAVILILWLTLGATPEPIDPALWLEYEMTELRGH